MVVSDPGKSTCDGVQVLVPVELEKEILPRTSFLQEVPEALKRLCDGFWSNGMAGLEMKPWLEFKGPMELVVADAPSFSKGRSDSADLGFGDQGAKYGAHQEVVSGEIKLKGISGDC